MSDSHKRTFFKISLHIIVFTLMINASCLLIIQKSNAQNNQVVQVKAFSENLNIYPNLNISINKGDFIELNDNGIAFVNLSPKDLPIQSIKLKDETLEVASWNLSKGILEVIIRKKNYIDKKIKILNEDGLAISNVEIKFFGRNNITKSTDLNGLVEIPLALEEKIKSKDQFEIKAYDIISFRNADIGILTAKKIATPIQTNESQNKLSDKSIPKKTSNRIDRQQIDTIRSLRTFYEVISKISPDEITADSQLKLDAKFDELLNNINEGNRRDSNELLDQISDSTVVEEDIDNLLKQARRDNASMSQQRINLENKIQMVRDKLNVGFENMADAAKEKLLVEIEELESTLESNKNEFNENLNTYLAVINELKRRFFDLQELENRLSESERERLKERKIYQQRLFLTLGVALLFAFLIILLFYFRSRLKKQQKKLIEANITVKNTNENLENIVLERTFLLNKTFKELDTVLYKASHDLRAPLSSIAGISDLITRETGNNELTSLLSKTNTKMDKLLKKLSIISEIHQPGKFEEIDLHEICSNLFSSYKSIISERDIDFKLNIQVDTKLVSIKKLVEVIIYHLLENAFFFSWIESKIKPEVTLNIQIKDGSLEIAVSDNGIGIESNIQHKIFEMFYVGNELSDGNGLGLYIVQKSAELLDGKVKVFSENDKNTTFIVLIPLNGKGSNTLEFLSSLKA